MTHDEIIAKVKNKDLYWFHHIKAVLSVVELHKPMLWKNLGNDTDGYKCQVCEGNSYPCPTIAAIEKELV